MDPSDDPIAPLRAALASTPDNVLLRRYLADTLKRQGDFAEALVEYKEVLKQAPSDEVRIALAKCYLSLDKVSHAAVLVEAITARDDAPAAAFACLAQVRMAERDLLGARSAFLKACEREPELAYSKLAKVLGLEDSIPDHGFEWNNGIEDDDDDDDDVDIDEDDEHERRKLRLGHGPDAGDHGRYGAADFTRPAIRFSDVGGMDEVKGEISIKVIQPLAHPDLFKAYGKSIGGGVLMYGPPGCGKTHIARATAGEAKAAFMSIGIHDVLEMYIGSSERNLHRLFDEARRRAPCVLFFDEVDALGAKRADAASSSSRQIINQFLAELDGVGQSNDGLLVLAATNAPWHLDSAFRRPGRFDRLVFVPPPDEAARIAILEVLLRDKPTEDIDTRKVAKKTRAFSGADLKGAIDLAVEGKLREALKTGRPLPLTTKDLLDAIKRMTPTTNEWFATAKNHVQFANQSGHYDDVARYLGMRGSQRDDA